MRKIKEAYMKKKVKCLLIVDQINTLATEYKKMNNLTKEKKKREENNQVFKLP